MKTISLLFATTGLLVALSGSPANAQEPSAHCTALKRDRFSAFFAQLRSQTVFGSKGFVGWRVYGPPEALQGLGLNPRDLVTHFCGVSLADLVTTEGDICCPEEVRDKVALAIVRDGVPLRIMASVLPSKPLQPIAPKDGAPAER